MVLYKRVLIVCQGQPSLKCETAPKFRGLTKHSHAGSGIISHEAQPFFPCLRDPSRKLCRDRRLRTARAEDG